MRFIFFHSKYAWEFSNLVFREVYLMRVWAMGNKFSPDLCILYSSRSPKTWRYLQSYFAAIFPILPYKNGFVITYVKTTQISSFFQEIIIYDKCEHTLDVFWNSELITSFSDVIVFFLIFGVWNFSKRFEIEKWISKSYRFFGSPCSPTSSADSCF